MAVRKITSSDTLSAGFRTKYNESVDLIIVSATLAPEGKVVLTTYNNQKLTVDLTTLFYTESEIDDLIKTLAELINKKQDIDSPGFKRILSENKSGDYQVTIPADSAFYSIEIKKESGTPIIKVGVTAGGTEIQEELTIEEEYLFSKYQRFVTEGLLYISVSGGTVTSNAIYFNKVFSV